ncbi:DUF1129 domain-containing protein [Companilactobacillus metriopterae]|uniref:DUF1129 domain-containing protein n=1 Tax=Companilactobacillus metriopterae TaxID=1909267 RepID=UPI00100C32C2|nr:DUF1129 family protein [Companilactobacillus metriopterae]
MSDDLREKNKKAINKQKEKVEKREKSSETEEQILTTDVSDLRSKLTNKNEEYVFKLNKTLVNDGFTEDEAQQVINELIPEIVSNQIKGIPANQLYGPVSQKVNDIVHPTKPVKKSPFWALGLDTSLLFLALFAIMYGIMGLMTKQSAKQGQQMGVVTLLILSGMWGYLLTWVNQQMKKPKSERPRLMVTIGYMLVGLVVMFGVLALTSVVPSMFNPSLNGTFYIVIAVVAYGGRFLFRRQFGITERGFI